jgi:hypothetical protein
VSKTLAVVEYWCMDKAGCMAGICCLARTLNAQRKCPTHTCHPQHTGRLLSVCLIPSCCCHPAVALQYETTANTLAFSLFCLATHPEAEAKVVAEIRAAAEREVEAQAAAAAAGVKHEPWFARNLEEQVGLNGRMDPEHVLHQPCTTAALYCSSCVLFLLC